MNCIRDKCKNEAVFFDLTYFESTNIIANLCKAHTIEYNAILGLIGKNHQFLSIDKNGLITVSMEWIKW